MVYKAMSNVTLCRMLELYPYICCLKSTRVTFRKGPRIEEIEIPTLGYTGFLLPIKVHIFVSTIILTNPLYII